MTLREAFFGAVFLSLLAIPDPSACQDLETVANDSSGTADGKTGPALTGQRHPLYRLKRSDVLEVHFTFAPEYDQSVIVQPDGFIALKDGGTLFVEGRTLPELEEAITRAYSFMRDPEISVSLKEFERPFFLAGGHIGHPGKYELRSATTVSEAISIAGGFTERSKHSQVVLFRKVHAGFVEARVLNLKAMLASRNLSEDLELKPGDMLYVPQNRISKINRYLPVASLSTFFSPAQF